MINTQEVNQQEDLSITPMSDLGHSDKANMIISELNSIYGRSKDKIGELIEVLRQEDKLNDKQIKAVLLNEVRFISRTTIYEALPDYMKRTYTKTPKALEDKQEEQKIDDTEIDQPVYKEPDRVEPRPQWTGKTPVEIEQSFTTAAAADKTNVPVQDKTVPMTFKTKARLSMRDNQKNRDYYVMLDVTCDPDKQTVDITPIDKMSIVYVKPDQ